MTMKSIILRTLWILISVCPWALVRAENRARTVKYSQTDIIPIHAKIRFSTLIVLPSDEEILDFTTGDKDFWIINGTHNLCYLHPALAGIRSNMNLVTASGHVYSFLLIETSKDTHGEPDLKVFVTANDQSTIAGNPNPAKYIRATEAEAYKEEVNRLRNQLAQDQEHAQDQAAKQVDDYKRNYPARLEFDYRFDRKAELAPFRVSAIYHDDRFTYIKSAANEKPTIYEIKDKKPNLVNFDLESGVYVVPKIIDNGYLVVGKKRVTFNRRGN
jgi:type IV secretory pathway VirB9-like protein